MAEGACAESQCSKDATTKTQDARVKSSSEASSSGRSSSGSLVLDNGVAIPLLDISGCEILGQGAQGLVAKWGDAALKVCRLTAEGEVAATQRLVQLCSALIGPHFARPIRAYTANVGGTRSVCQEMRLLTGVTLFEALQMLPDKASDLGAQLLVQFTSMMCILRQGGEGEVAATQRLVQLCSALIGPHFARPIRAYTANVGGTRSVCQEMRLLTGTTLFETLQHLKMLPDKASDLGARLLAQFTSMMCMLRQARLVHRDVKPSNLVLERGVLVLIDMDLVMQAGEACSGVTGTPAYMPPESLRGQGAAAAAADIYAFGVILYQALHRNVCAHPHLDEHLMCGSPTEVAAALQEAARAGRAVSWSEAAVSSSSEGLRRVVEGMVCLDASKRFGVEEVLLSAVWDEPEMQEALQTLSKRSGALKKSSAYVMASRDREVKREQQKVQQCRQKQGDPAVVPAAATGTAAGVPAPRAAATPAAPTPTPAPAPSPAPSSTPLSTPAPPVLSEAPMCPAQPSAPPQSPVNLWAVAKSVAALVVFGPVVALALPPFIVANAVLTGVHQDREQRRQREQEEVEAGCQESGWQGEAQGPGAAAACALSCDGGREQPSLAPQAASMRWGVVAGTGSAAGTSAPLLLAGSQVLRSRAAAVAAVWREAHGWVRGPAAVACWTSRLPAAVGLMRRAGGMLLSQPQVLVCMRGW
eukprot:CAMPEP_0202920838 /NCGR_PEP_ID=MMETSP1392-20130828/77068_1 /ASSEMBLY_ACC=CAM_ASM_000868 /TAXON_ID=225041 /ORGANISM="Chlamydomonas chlamydogama, Strain SAG 11-48b" /LENGTH=699 /DNA_ID=CAMNT_0049614353 /DNA_START=72 /DNA_END=2172 /DNA_ORIENTATION=-